MISQVDFLDRVEKWNYKNVTIVENSKEEKNDEETHVTSSFLTELKQDKLGAQHLNEENDTCDTDLMFMQF